MSPRYTLRLTEAQHRALQAHLFPDDSCEAVAFLVCGRRNGSRRHILTTREVVLVPFEDCVERRPDHVRWRTDILESILASHYGKGQAIVKVHSHRGDFRQFSRLDDSSDLGVFQSVASYFGDGLPHASVIMLPSGEMFGRVITSDGALRPLSAVSVVGDDLRFWTDQTVARSEAFAQRQAQAFGDHTSTLLRQLTIGVVGCSGTGSFVVEQLARLGTGRLVLVDPDHIEEKNLSRVVNASKKDAYLATKKVSVLAAAIARMGLGQEVLPLPLNLATVEAVTAIAECDVVFGCMDSAEGRHLLNRLATFYNLPYFDVGVRLEADGEGGIAGISSASHYVQPGHSSLLSREVYTMADVEAEELRRTSPQLYERQLADKYIRGVEVERPAVISVNALAAAVVVNDFLARLHPYRNLPNRGFACIRTNFAEMQCYLEGETTACSLLAGHVGRGDVVPMLDRPYLS